MSKRKKSQKQNSETRQPTPAHINATSGQMSADELQHIIANAIMEAEDMKAKREADKKAKELAQWHEVIGYDKSKKGIKKVWNNITTFFKVLFIPNQQIKGDKATTAIIQGLLQLCFKALFGICFFIAFALIANITISFALPNIENLNAAQIIFYILMALSMFIISGIFRIASIEAEKMEDRNNLYGLFASIASIISIVIAVIAIVKGK